MPSPFNQDELLDDESSQAGEPGAADKGSNSSKEVLDRLQQIDEKVQGGQLLAQLVADPDFRKLMEAKQAGKKLKLVEETDETPNVGPTGSDDEEVDLDTLDNKQLVKHMMQGFAKLSKSMLSAELSPIVERLKQSEGIAMSVQKERIQQQVAKAREKFEDFDTYKDAMLHLNAENRGLSVEELYVLAKTRAGHLSPVSQRKLSSERPSSAPPRPGQTARRKQPAALGRAGFNQLLADAMESFDFGSQEGFEE